MRKILAPFSPPASLITASISVISIMLFALTNIIPPSKIMMTSRRTAFFHRQTSSMRNSNFFVEALSESTNRRIKEINRHSSDTTSTAATRKDFSTAAFASLFPNHSQAAREMKRIRPKFATSGAWQNATTAAILTDAKNATLRRASSTADDNGDAPVDEKDEQYDFDLLVIGAGSGGIASARRAASYGAKVAVVEMGLLGGTCVNVGCVPKKVMWNAASISETLHDMHHYGFSGYESGAVRFDWGFIQRSRDAYIQRLNDIYDRNMMNSGVTRLTGKASLARSDDDGAGDGGVKVIVTPIGNRGEGQKTEQRQQHQQQTIKAKHILLATGGYPEMPRGSDGSIPRHAISSDGFFDLESLPRRAVVVGAGYIAVELAGVLQALGTETSLVVRKERALRNFDDMIAETLDTEMERQGITIFRNTNGVGKISLDEQTGLKTVVLNNGEMIEDVDVVIMAAGRRPAVESLNLKNVGVEQKDGGYISVNEYSETNVGGVYAVGDVCGNVELTPMGEFLQFDHYSSMKSFHPILM
ncbi:hypothetical protein ACHAXS_007633 [Conticribra weissflogii]